MSATDIVNKALAALAVEREEALLAAAKSVLRRKADLEAEYKKDLERVEKQLEEVRDLAANPGRALPDHYYTSKRP